MTGLGLDRILQLAGERESFRLRLHSSLRQSGCACGAAGFRTAEAVRLIRIALSRDCPHLPMKLTHLAEHPVDGCVSYIAAIDVERLRRSYPDEVVIL